MIVQVSVTSKKAVAGSDSGFNKQSDIHLHNHVSCMQQSINVLAAGDFATYKFAS